METKTDKTTLEELSNSLDTSLINEIKELGNVVTKALVEDVPRHKMPEIVFKDMFLDHFKSVANRTSTDNTLSLAWIGLAGSPYAEVDVIDSASNVLFTVPGLLARPSISNDAMSNYDMSNIAANYKLKSNQMQVVGERYMAGAINGLDQAVKKEDNSSAARWQAILHRYDKPASDGKTTESKLEDNLELDYE